MAAKPFNGTRNPPSGKATRAITLSPPTTADTEARKLLGADTRTKRVAPPKTVNQPSSSNAVSRQVTGTKHSGGARLTGGNA